GDDLRKLPFTIKLSRKTLNIIKANIAFAIGIKLIALLLVIPGWLTLWIAILSDMGATLVVALNGLRLMRVKEDELSLGSSQINKRTDVQILELEKGLYRYLQLLPSM